MKERQTKHPESFAHNLRQSHSRVTREKLGNIDTNCSCVHVLTYLKERVASPEEVLQTRMVPSSQPAATEPPSLLPQTHDTSSFVPPFRTAVCTEQGKKEKRIQSQKAKTFVKAKEQSSYLQF